MRLIWVRTEAEYFWRPGLTLFRKIGSDLVAGPARRTRWGNFFLRSEANVHFTAELRSMKRIDATIEWANSNRCTSSGGQRLKR
jgi:hypothetical protein